MVGKTIKSRLLLFITYLIYKLYRSSWTFINVVVELDLKRSGQAGP